MKYDEAFHVLELNSNNSYTECDIKSQYKKLSLKYHPDKNSAEDACYKFQQVHEAYLALLDHVKEDMDQSPYDDDNDPLNLNPVWDSIYASIYKQIVELYNSNTWNIIESIDKTVLLKLYSFLCKHRKRFPQWGEVLLHHLGLLLKFTLKPMEETSKNRKQYIIYPKLCDLLACNLYKHIEKGIDGKEEVFLVPCWMEESIFDYGNDGGEIIIYCIPVFPSGVWMDDYRNIHTVTEYSIIDVWNNPNGIDVLLGDVTFTIRKDELRLLKQQTIIRRGNGIPIGNTVDVFDVSMKSNIVIHIQIR